jgi:predicted lipoprotein with Yx(FWY)xxD motif
VLVDSEGLTLYYFQKDKKGSGVSKCEGACAEGWPPLTTEGEPEATSGINASMLGTIKRSDGTTQVTYAGWPLYTFVEDSKPGEDNGTDSTAFGASWYPLHADGQKAGH